MNRYDAKTGTVQHVPEPEEFGTAARAQTGAADGRAEYRKPPGSSGILDMLGGLLSKAKRSVPETEDLILIAVLYLMYRESGDIEFLLIAGILLFT